MGAGIFCGYNGDLTVAGSTLAANRGSFGGGLFNDNGGVVHLEGSTFVDDDAAGWGGAIATVGFGSGANTGTMLTAETGSRFTITVLLSAAAFLETSAGPRSR